VLGLDPDPIGSACCAALLVELDQAVGAELIGSIDVKFGGEPSLRIDGCHDAGLLLFDLGHWSFSSLYAPTIAILQIVASGILQIGPLDLKAY